MAKNKKRKRDNNDTNNTTDPSTPTKGDNDTTESPNNNNLTSTNEDDNLETSKPTAVFHPQGPRPWTLSVALPGSIIANAQSHDQKTSLAGNIARALAVFNVDEVIIFNDGDEGPDSTTTPIHDDTYTARTHPSHFLAHILSYLETPAHLRKSLFQHHANLKTAGTLPSTDMPHHLRAREWCEYREGIVVESNDDETSVDVGTSKLKVVKGVSIPLKSRVTVKLARGSDVAEVVAPDEPRVSAGYYWGYAVRQCASLSTVLTECPFDGGYDLSIGFSERGRPLGEVVDTIETPRFQHALLVFGGVAGLETAAKNDPELQDLGIGKGSVGELFDCWVNLMQGQGSRTIRTEEAVWLGLMGTRGLMERR